MLCGKLNKIFHKYENFQKINLREKNAKRQAVVGTLNPATWVRLFIGVRNEIWNFLFSRYGRARILK